MRIQSRKLDSGLWGNYDFLMQHGEDEVIYLIANEDAVFMRKSV